MLEILMPRVVKAEPLVGFRLRLTFDDGVQGEVDLSPLVGTGVFAAWVDRREFEKVELGSGGELKWGDQIDLCPDSMYLRITGKAPEDLFPNLKAIAQHA